MKRAILGILLTTSTAFAGDMQLALDAPVSISQTVVSQVQASTVEIKYITIDPINQRIEVGFVGINKNLVKTMTNAQWTSFKTSFVSSYGSTLKTMITDHFASP